MENINFPTVKLSNGLVVGNFSSPHEFKFVTGEVLAGCSPEHSRMGSLESKEIESVHPKGWTDIELKFFLSGDVERLLHAAHAMGEVDIWLVPFPVLEAVKRDQDSPFHPANGGKIRVIRNADRVTKAIYPDRFCV
jgi:hypothetical protein